MHCIKGMNKPWKRMRLLAAQISLMCVFNFHLQTLAVVTATLPASCFGLGHSLAPTVFVLCTDKKV